MRRTMSRMPGSRREGGFSLVEVLTAIIIFGIVAVGSMTFFTYGRTHINRSTRRRLALELGRDKMERLKATAYADIGSGVESEVALGSTATCIRTTTSTERSVTMGKYKELSVRVQWPAESPTNDIWLYTVIASP